MLLRIDQTFYCPALATLPNPFRGSNQTIAGVAILEIVQSWQVWLERLLVIVVVIAPAFLVILKLPLVEVGW